MIPNMIAAYQKNGLSTAMTQLLEPSALSQAKVFGETSQEAAIGDPYSFPPMNGSVTSSLDAGTTISVSTANWRELTYFSTLKTLVSLLKGWLRLTRKEFSLTVKSDTTSSSITCQRLSSPSLTLSSNIALSKWLSQLATSKKRWRVEKTTKMAVKASTQPQFFKKST